MAKGEIKIRSVRPEDKDAWARMRRHLFPDFDPPEIDQFYSTGSFDGFDQCEVFVAETADGDLAGFAEASARPYAEGCSSTPVAYLEAWFVEEAWRKTGVGRQLVDAVEAWARERGMTELASDAEITNSLSHKAHGALGFHETDRIVCFFKKL